MDSETSGPGETLKIIDKLTDRELLAFSFTSADFPDNPAQLHQYEKNQQKLYPLLQKLPYQTNNFYIDYTDPLTLEIVFDGNSDSKREALDWIILQGIDPASHTINWKITSQ